MSPSGKATDFDSVMRRFESYHPNHFCFLGKAGKIKENLKLIIITMLAVIELGWNQFTVKVWDIIDVKKQDAE